MVLQEIDFKKVTDWAMSAFRSRLLRYNIENGEPPPLSEYEAAAWVALQELLNAVLEPLSTIVNSETNIRNHFDLQVEYLSADTKLVSIQVVPKSSTGQHLLDMMDAVEASFT